MEQIKEYAVMILFGAFILLGMAYINKERNLEIPKGYHLIKDKDLNNLNSRIERINQYHKSNQVYQFFE